MKAVQLIKLHTHAGIEHRPGTIITVAAGTADYLEAHGIGQKISTKALSTSRHSKNKRTKNKEVPNHEPGTI